MKKGTFYVISAASGTGKTSLVKQLTQDITNLSVSISYTTRTQRQGEIHGKHYFFVDQDTFKSMAEQGEFFEYAENYGNYYGTAKQGIQQILDQGEDVILEIDWQGQAQIKQLMPQSVSIFILPPSLEALKKRLTGRAQDSDTVIARRLEAARTEIQYARDYDYIIINDDFNQALSDLSYVIKAQRHHVPTHQEYMDEVIEQLYRVS